MMLHLQYTDSTKTAFKSSTRLECMMQDYPKTLPASARVGFTVTEKWLAYAPVKYNPQDAAKVPKGNANQSATSGEIGMWCCIVQVEVMRGLEDRDDEYKSLLNEKLQGEGGQDGSGLIQVYRKELEDRLSIS